MDLFGFVPGYTSVVYDTGREPAFAMLVAFLLTFAGCRGYTRIARVRGWGSAHVGGVHMHHVVVGMVLAFVAGALEFAFLPGPGPAQLLLAIAFGSGVALVLDEFALVFHLTDVYWEREGRKSIDAIVISAVLGGLFLLHATPFNGDAGVGRWSLTVTIAVNVLFVLAAALKGKMLMATFGVFVPGLAIVGAIRLAEPDSAWARRRYPPGSRKRRRAEARHAALTAKWGPRKERAWDLIGGASWRPGSGS